MAEDVTIHQSGDVKIIAGLISMPMWKVRTAMNSARFWIVKVEGKTCGFFMVRKLKKMMPDFHAYLMPPCRGKIALQAGRLLMADLKSSGVKELSSFVAPSNRPAQIAAALIGFRRERIAGDGTIVYAKQF